MRIERQRFLALTAAMAAGCAAAPPPAIELAAPPAPTASVETVPSALPPAVIASAAPAAPPPPKAPEECAEEDVGSQAICGQLKIAPTCENAYGAKAACEDLIRMYRPAVAERIASCSVKGAANRKRCPRSS